MYGKSRETRRELKQEEALVKKSRETRRGSGWREKNEGTTDKRMMKKYDKSWRDRETGQEEGNGKAL